MMHHLHKISSTTNDSTRKDLENTLFKLEGKMSKRLSNIQTQTSPNKVVKLGMFTMLYSVFILTGCYYSGLSIHSFQKTTTSKQVLMTAEKEIITIKNLNKQLDHFFEIAMNAWMTEDDVAIATSMIARLYNLYLGYNLANETILSVLNLDKLDAKRSFNYTDLKLFFDSFFFIIHQTENKLISRLSNDVSARNEDPLVQLSKFVSASTLLRKCYYLNKMICRFQKKFDDSNNIFRHLIQVKGHMTSLFLENLAQNTRFVIKKIDQLVKSYPWSGNEISNECVTNMEILLPLNVSTETLNISHGIILQQLEVRDSRVQSSRTELIISLLVLIGTIITCGLLVVAYNCKLEQLNDLKFCDSFLEQESCSENSFFLSTMADVIPKQLLASANLDKLVKASKQKKRLQKDCDDESDVFHRVSFENRSSLVKTHKVSSSFEDHFGRHSTCPILHSIKALPKMSEIKSEPYIQEFTVMIINIVNFNRLMNYLSANEVVNVITHVTRLLDERSSFYDVFVASKGSPSFTVISGFTEEQKRYHASQIANMALDISVSCGDLEVDNVPDAKLRLRIGIHTDSGHSSVVSFPKKQFRIYGEILKTVQTIQKTSVPNKIQISDTTYKLLSRDRVYNIQKRGYIDLKGGKKICTHWLFGKRISTISLAPELCYRRRSTVVYPIELEQRPLYDFDVEEGMPPVWTHAHLFKPDEQMMPHCSYSFSDSQYNSRYLGHDSTLVEETEF